MAHTRMLLGKGGCAPGQAEAPGVVDDRASTQSEWIECFEEG